MSCVELPKVVVRAEPLKRTTELPTKFVPLTVRVNPAAPAAALVGEILVIVGVGLAFTVNVWEFDVPPPGVGLKTVIRCAPVDAKSLAGIAAVSSVELLKVVVRSEPSNRTTELETKFVPLTVRVNAPSPTNLLVGEMLVVVGTGLFTLSVPLPLLDPLVSVPDPVTVKVVVPAGVEPVVVTVSVVLEPPPTEAGENEPEAPAGNPLTVSVLTVQLPPVLVVLTV